MNSRASFGRGLAVLIVSLAALPAQGAPGDRSPDGLWLEVDRTELGTVRDPLPTTFRAYRLDFAAIQAALSKAPREVPGRGTSPVVISLPLPDGTFAPASVESSPVLSRELALQYPNVQTFVFHGENGISGRLTLGPSSLQAILRPPSDYTRVTPLVTPTGTFYLSFLHRDRTDGADDFRHQHEHDHDTEPDPPAIQAGAGASLGFAAPLAPPALQAGDQLREYRLAVASTGEYYQARAGANGVDDVVSSIVTEINNANLVFEAELSVRLVINWFVLYSDAANDPYSTINPNGNPAVTV
jgi:hypothetical protein